MTFQDDAAGLLALQGRLCVFKERLFIRLVRVEQVTTDDWGAWFDLRIVPAPGFVQDDHDDFSVSVSWEFMGISERKISATYVNWIIVIRDELVEKIMAAAAQGVHGPEMMEYVNKVAFGHPDV